MKRIIVAITIIISSMSLIGCSELNIPSSNANEINTTKNESVSNNEVLNENSNSNNQVQNENTNNNLNNNEIQNGNTNNSQTINETSKISIEEAKSIALTHANLTSDKVSFIKAKNEFDNGIDKYDIEFYYENTEYDYEINASNGQIIKYDYDVENYNINRNQNVDRTVNNVSTEQAKEIALKHANLTANEVIFAKVELDFDDGIQKYEVKFYNNNIEYEYNIDANTGEIVSYERE